MDEKITRRDFINGAAGLVAGAALAPGCTAPKTSIPGGSVGTSGKPPDPNAYPPSRLGLRGSHTGAFEVAHQMAFEQRTDWGLDAEPDPGDYDLVVVGAGVSGLAAAFFYREQHPGARVLLLENHDDFGGHAKRNEFPWNDRTIIGYGGSQSLEAPSNYSAVSKQLLSKIGVEPTRLDDAYDRDFYRRHGLAQGFFFERGTWGSDRLVQADLVDIKGFIPVAPANLDIDDAVAKMPLSESARRELLRVIQGDDDALPEHSVFREPGYLSTISYVDFLKKHLRVEHQEVIDLLRDIPSGYFGHGADVIPAIQALSFGLPGVGSTSLGAFAGPIRRLALLASESYTYHFPDGNASVARLLVRRLIPGAAGGTTMDDVVTATFDYEALDKADAEVRLRLRSTVVRVEHDGDPNAASRVGITYVRDGRTERVRARHVVLACYNMTIPYLCPELPDRQKQALGQLVKMPLVYTNVLLRNWRAFKKLGVGVVHSPGSWHTLAMLDFPVSMGDYRFSQTPDDPVIVHMSRVPGTPGRSPDEQSRAGRRELLDTSFETIEREIRTHLGGMLRDGGFDPGRDIVGIAVNRWPHGYAWETNRLYDPEYAEGERPWEIGRKRFGRVAIANSDAGGSAYLNVAIDQAWRAVGELTA
jgi:spermidine dehydrogenase